MPYGSPRPNYRPKQPSLFDYFTQAITIQAQGGTPNVTDLPFDLIEQNGQPYMRRHFLLGADNTAPGTTARYHNILTSDLAALHDHPWDFISIILNGTYIETTPNGETEHRAGSVLARRAEDLHRLTLPDGPVWTFIVVSPPRRHWGFQTDDGWVYWADYLADGRPSQTDSPGTTTAIRTASSRS